MWCVKLTDAQREAVSALIEGKGEVGPSLSGALEALEFARWDDLPDASLPWQRVSELASVQGISEADVVWDLAAGLPPPSEPAGARPKAVARRPPRRV